MNKVKNILLWVFSIFMFLCGAVIIGEAVISALLMFAIGIISNPLFLKRVHTKRIIKTNVLIWNTKNISYPWEDKAGGYGIQTSFGAKYIKKINGDYNNVVGLPISRLYQELKSFIRNSE